MCVVEAAGWRVCKGGGRGQTGNDEVIAKRKAGWEGGARRSDIDSEMSSAAEAWAAPSLSPSSLPL